MIEIERKFWYSNDEVRKMRVVNMQLHDPENKKLQIYDMQKKKREYKVIEMLLEAQSSYRDYAKRENCYTEYKVRLEVPQLGESIRTYHIRYVENKKTWYIVEECDELVSIHTYKPPYYYH